VPDVAIYARLDRPWTCHQVPIGGYGQTGVQLLPFESQTVSHGRFFRWLSETEGGGGGGGAGGGGGGRGGGGAGAGVGFLWANVGAATEIRATLTSKAFKIRIGVPFMYGQSLNTINF